VCRIEITFIEKKIDKRIFEVKICSKPTKTTAKKRRTSNSILIKKNYSFFKYIFHEQPLHKNYLRCYVFPRNSFEPFRIPKKDENEKKYSTM